MYFDAFSTLFFSAIEFDHIFLFADNECFPECCDDEISFVKCVQQSLAKLSIGGKTLPMNSFAAFFSARCYLRQMVESDYEGFFYLQFTGNSQCTARGEFQKALYCNSELGIPFTSPILSRIITFRSDSMCCLKGSYICNESSEIPKKSKRNFDTGNQIWDT